ncbi:PREDICTED: uncharacterized protein LOC104806256 [Tarenaya hassleriana]|uniref:uncharacterized protein LOC104806256 n=1 Tax=Tarenaya hassleriana TaxID=28532 RepID=UPI00053C948E|nr:PREDICTED: uncharacterized protein LOC104806256 [Tarenaya hassleriana]
MDVFFESQRGLQFSIEVGYFDTVLEIKEKIDKYQRIPVSKQTLIFDGRILQDDHNVEQCQILQNSRIQLLVSSSDRDRKRDSQAFVKTEQSPPPSDGTDAVNGQDSSYGTVTTKKTKKMRVMVLTKCGKRKIPVEVNGTDKVGELRKELSKVRQRFQFSLPQEGYFFIYKQNVMDDDQSFRWHGVDHGDTIEIFNGSVSGGP